MLRNLAIEDFTTAQKSGNIFIHTCLLVLDIPLYILQTYSMSKMFLLFRAIVKFCNTNKLFTDLGFAQNFPFPHEIFVALSLRLELQFS